MPSTLNEALSLKQELNEAAFKDSEREGYRFASVCSCYTKHGHKLRILKIRDNIIKIEKLVKRLRND